MIMQDYITAIERLNLTSPQEKEIKVSKVTKVLDNFLWMCVWFLMCVFWVFEVTN